VNQFKKIKPIEQTDKTMKLCDETILDHQEENTNKTKKVEEWLDKNKNNHSPSSKVSLNNKGDNLKYLEPLADSTNIIIEERPAKGAKSPNHKKFTNIILDTCLDSVDSTCSTNSKNLVIHEPSNLDGQADSINKNNNQQVQPDPNNENEPEKLQESKINRFLKLK
jgi:hypothetical protein